MAVAKSTVVSATACAVLIVLVAVVVGSRSFRSQLNAEKHDELFEEELKDLRAENEQLRARLAELESSLPASRTNDNKASDNKASDVKASDNKVSGSDESQKQKSQESVARRWGLNQAEFEIQVLKVEQSGSFTQMSVQVKNRSDAFLAFWSVSIAIYDKTNTFLGTSLAVGTNLKPHAAVVDKVNFNNVSAKDISTWKLRLDRITATKDLETLYDADKFFTLIEAKGESEKAREP